MDKLAKSLCFGALSLAVAFVFTVPTMVSAVETSDKEASYANTAINESIVETRSVDESVSQEESVDTVEPETIYVEIEPEGIWTTRTNIFISNYDDTLNYTTLMEDAIQEALQSEDPTYALNMGEIYEVSRNLKIQEENLDYDTTDYFAATNGSDAQEIYYLMHPEERPFMEYTEKEAMALAKIVYSEARGGSDEHQRDVASVVVNRAMMNYGGNSTIIGVITAPGQYVNSSRLASMSFDDKAYQNAIYVLENGPTLPSNVVYQANFKQGSGVHKTYYYEWLEYPYTYFCYR